VLHNTLQVGFGPNFQVGAPHLGNIFSTDLLIFEVVFRFAHELVELRPLHSLCFGLSPPRFHDVNEKIWLNGDVQQISHNRTFEKSVVRKEGTGKAVEDFGNLDIVVVFCASAALGDHNVVIRKISKRDDLAAVNPRKTGCLKIN